MLLLSQVLWDGRQIRACWECCYLSWRLLRSVPHLLWLAVRSPTWVCFRISHFFPGFWQNCKNGTKRAPQVEGSQSLQIFLFQSLQTQQKCLKGSYLQIWQCRMEENCLQVFIRIHILMIFSFTWRNTGSLDIEQGLKVQNCGQTLLTYISLLNYVSLGLLLQIEYSTGSSCKVHL